MVQPFLDAVISHTNHIDVLSTTFVDLAMGNLSNLLLICSRPVKLSSLSTPDFEHEIIDLLGHADQILFYNPRVMIE